MNKYYVRLPITSDDDFIDILHKENIEYHLISYYLGDPSTNLYSIITDRQTAMKIKLTITQLTISSPQT
jgi:hypothetical protein